MKNTMKWLLGLGVAVGAAAGTLYLAKKRFDEIEEDDEFDFNNSDFCDGDCDACGDCNDTYNECKDCNDSCANTKNVNESISNIKEYLTDKVKKGENILKNSMNVVDNNKEDVIRKIEEVMSKASENLAHNETAKNTATEGANDGTKKTGKTIDFDTVVGKDDKNEVVDKKTTDTANNDETVANKPEKETIEKTENNVEEKTEEKPEEKKEEKVEAPKEETVKTETETGEKKEEGKKKTSKKKKEKKEEEEKKD